MRKASPGTTVDLTLIALAVLFFSWPWLKDGVPIGDFSGMATWAWYLLKSLRELGRVAWWSPYWFDGSTFLVVTPTFLQPFYILPFAALLPPVEATKAAAIFAHVLSGWSAYGLLRSLLKDKEAALFGGLAYALHPAHIATTAFFGHLEHTSFYVLMPLALWAYGRALEERRARTVILAAASWAAMLLFDPQLSALFAPTLLLQFLFHLARQVKAKGRSAIWPSVGVSLLAAAIAFGLSAFWLVSNTLEYGLNNPITAEEADGMLPTNSLDALPILWDRSGQVLRQEPPAYMMFPSGLPRWEAAPFLGMYYMGISLLLLGFVAGVLFLWEWLSQAHKDDAQGTAPARHFSLLLVSFVLAALMAMGPYSLAENLSGLGLNVPVATAWPVLVVSVLLLALSFTLPRLGMRVPARLPRLLLALGLTGLLALALLFSRPFLLLREAMPLYARLRVPMRFASIMAATLCLLAPLAIVALRRRLPRPIFGAAFALLLAVLLWDFYPYRQVFAWQHDPADLQKTYTRLAQDGDRFRAWGVYLEAYVDLGIIYSGKPAFSGWVDWNVPGHSYTYARYSGGRLFIAYPAAPQALMLGLANVKYIVSDAAINPEFNEHLRRSSDIFPLVSESPEFLVFENRLWRPYAQAYPRRAAYLGAEPNHLFAALPLLAERGVALVQIENPAEAAGLFDLVMLSPGASESLRERAAALRREGAPLVFLPEKPEDVAAALAPYLPEPAGAAGQPAIEWQRPDPERIEVKTKSAEPFTLAVAESWYPHWLVQVDGAEAGTAQRVNYAFQGVEVPAGEHTVAFYYRRPGYVSLAYLLTGLTVFGLAGWAVFFRPGSGSGGNCCRRQTLV